jgi:outer membrane protein assembly factor BamD
MRLLRFVSARIFLIAGLITVLAACSGGSDDKAYVEKPVNELYNSAVNAIENQRYLDAAQLFEEVERQHPYSVWATKAQIMAAYANYEASKYDDAIIALNRFIQLHPGSRDVAYAYYLKALSFYEQISDIQRDQAITNQALTALRDIVRRFPRSKFARDAKLKIDLTQDHLAGKEMTVGRYYLRRKELLSAINRFRIVVDKFQTTSHVPEALHRLTEAYATLGMRKEAQKAAAVLGHNYPGSEWYSDSYALVTGKDKRQQKDKPGFLKRAWNWVF